MKIKFSIVMLVILAAFCVTLASGTVTTFKTGPFSVSVDLGTACNDTNISKPVSSEDLGGDSYTVYDVFLCNAQLYINRHDKDTFDLTSAFPTTYIHSDLVINGADKDTIALYDRTIDGKLGAAGSGYVPKIDKTLYEAAFYVSPKSYCYIYVWGNQTMMVSALKTIHITEAV
jgi:hypothetical protein